MSFFIQGFQAGAGRDGATGATGPSGLVGATGAPGGMQQWASAFYSSSNPPQTLNPGDTMSVGELVVSPGFTGATLSLDDQTIYLMPSSTWYMTVLIKTQEETGSINDNPVNGYMYLEMPFFSTGELDPPVLNYVNTGGGVLTVLSSNIMIFYLGPFVP